MAPSKTTTDPAPNARSKPVVEVLLITAIAAVVFGLHLGTGGLAFTEGHRAIPGWTMLQSGLGSGDWLVPRMFEQAYLRKPPGMPWLIAISSALLGETPLAARLPSAIAATLMALTSWWFARRWFGPKAGLAAGLAMVLMPWIWESARAAEIESAHTLGAQLATLGLIDLFVRKKSVILPATLIALGATLAVMTKGPAAAAVVGGALFAGLAFARPRSIVRTTAAIAGLGIAAAVFTAWTLAVRSHLTETGELATAVTQSPGAFLFNADKLLALITLPAAAFIASMPASFALLFPWGPDARHEVERGNAPAATLRTARALAWAWLIAILISMAAGISNVRYTLPAAPLTAVLAGYVFAGLAEGWLMPKRAAIARLMSLGDPRAMLGLLLVGAAIWIGLIEPRKRATSGAEAGRVLAEQIAAMDADPVIVADEVIEARPETLWALSQQLTGARVVWVPGLSNAENPNKRIAVHTPQSSIAVIRVDTGSNEAKWALDRGLWPAVEPGLLHPDAVSVHKYDFGVVVFSSDDPDE